MKRIALVALVAASLNAGAADVARLERVSGDRQIKLAGLVFGKSFQVRAVDAEGLPAAGVGIFIGKVTKLPPGPYLADPYGYRGFNADLEEIEYVRTPDEYARTALDGIVTIPANAINPSPSAFPIGARVDLNAPIQVFFSAVSVRSVPVGRPSVVVEYYNAAQDHYFNTLLQAEIDALDAGVFAGWTRSTGAFIAYASAADAPAQAVPVCRFFSSRYTSHFYSADAAECDAVAQKWPDVWQLETTEAFYILLPNKVTGACPPNYQAVYRLYNNANSPNHRYVTDAEIRDVMVKNGWVAEGYGPNAAIMCTPG
ncbi:MAG: hypothetical protein ABIR52_00290 [Casimicrobiaceae bacterium]